MRVILQKKKQIPPWYLQTNFRKSPRGVFFKKGIHKNFAKSTGKHQCRIVFFNKITASASNLIKKESPAQVFSYEFCEIVRNSFFIKHLRATASEILCIEMEVHNKKG